MAPPSRRRAWPWLLLLVAVGGALWAWQGRGGAAGRSSEPLWTVRRGTLRVTVTEGGSLQSLKSTTITSGVEGETKILTIVDEGTQLTPADVAAGRVLVELDASNIEEKRRRQQITVSDAQSNVAQAEEALKIQENQNESDLRKADLDVKFARIDLQKYLGATLGDEIEAHAADAAKLDLRTLARNAALEGEALQQRRARESEIDLAREEVSRAKDKLRWTEELLGKGFVSQDEQVADRLALKRQEVALEQATTALDLFLQYEFPKQVEQLASDLREAKEAFQRTRSRGESAEAKSRADLNGKKERLALETAELERYLAQIASCVIRATGPGLVVYASSEDRGNWQGDGSPIQQGASVRARQPILVIPDPQSLGVRVNVHESALSRVKPEQHVLVTVDAIPDTVFSGRVLRVATMPNAANRWQNPDLKVYATEISIEDARASLRPGMSARVEIVVGDVADVLQVPVQAVTIVAGKPHVWVRGPDGDAARAVRLGASSDRFIEVAEGLEEGNLVLLAPPKAGPRPATPKEGGGEASRPEAGAAPSAGATPRKRDRARPASPEASTPAAGAAAPATRQP